MSSGPVLSIGGVELRLELPPASDLVESSPRYTPFLGEHASGGSPAVPVRLRLDPAPPAVGEPVFDTGDTWLAFRDGRGLRIEFRHRRPSPRALWVLRVPEALEDGVDVHCGEELVARRSGGLVIENPVRYPLDQLLAVQALRGTGLLVHAAAVRGNGRGVVLPGRSGAGKSTSMRRLRGVEALERLSDDRAVVRRGADGGFRLWGTPWAGDEGVAVAADAPLVALAFLHKAPEERLVRIPEGEALRRLLPTVSLLGWDGRVAQESLGLCRELVERVTCYAFQFRREGDVAGLLGELLSGVPGAQ